MGNNPPKVYRLDKPEPPRVLLVHGVGWLAKYRLVRKVDLAQPQDIDATNTTAD